jgi:DNA-directed RNA polymerase specialized sigma24 family protein
MNRTEKRALAARTKDVRYQYLVDGVPATRDEAFGSPSKRAVAPRGRSLASLQSVTESTRTVAKAQARQLEAVRRARADGFSWVKIAEALGVSHQAARKRFVDKV